MKKLCLFLSLCLLLSGCAVCQRLTVCDTPAPTAEPTIVPTPDPTPDPTPEPKAKIPPARELAYTIGIFSFPADHRPGHEIAPILSSGKCSTLKAEQPFTRLYLRWSRVPGQWTLESNGKTLTFGQNGYLHELVELPEPTDQVTIFLPFGDHAETVYLNGAAVFTDGSLPDWVQDWQPPCEKADLLVLSTHNDDDILFFGGTEPYYATERQLKVQVVYFIRHRDGYGRSNEALDALWYMGIRNYPVFSSFPDFIASVIEECPYHISPADGKAYLCENIRRFRPEVIVTQDVNGEYGHLVHVYMLSLFREVIEETADADKYPASAELYGIWDVPKTYIHLWGDEEEQTVMDWDIPLSAFNALPAIEVARNAFMLHSSQYEQGNHLVEGRYDPYSSYRFGLYRSLVGEDEAKNDFFEHLPIQSR